MLEQNCSRGFSERFRYAVGGIWGGWFDFLVAFVIIVAPILAVIYTSFPSWLASLVVVAGWGILNYACWSYEAWRASGPRGAFVNPYGVTDNMLINVAWLLFGVFFIVLHIVYRFLSRD